MSSWQGGYPQEGPVLIYDDDHIYIAAVIAEQLASRGQKVIFATPECLVSTFATNTLEQRRIQARLIELGVEILCNQSLGGVTRSGARLRCVFTGREADVPCASTVLVTDRSRETTLHETLKPLNLKTLELIGDAAQPGLIVDAVFSGHLAARNFERPAEETDKDWFRREIIELEEV